MNRWLSAQIQFGNTPSDDALELVMESLRWSSHSEPVEAHLDSLIVGQSYKLQLLFYEECCSRGFDVFVDGVQIADEFSPQAVQGAGFGDVLNQFVGEVNSKQMASTQAVNDLLSGKDIPLHQAMIAMQEAGVAFQLMVEVRNKLLEGYQELMRMQV